jgi:hypothetical protein
MTTMVLTIAVSAVQAQTGQPASGADGAAANDRQPQWTARPLFGETDVYVLPRGVSAFVFGLRPVVAGDRTLATDSAYRVEFGLPARFQLGLHATGRAYGRDDVIGNIDAQALELRWALADWGALWGNPAVHVEWREASRGADSSTVKLLLGSGTASGWRWGSNVAWTQEASGARAIDRAWTAGVSRDGGRFVSVGIETRLAFVDRLAADGRTRTALAREFLAGPSVQLRPLRRMYIDVAPLFGASAASPMARTTIAAGWEF